MHPRMDPGERVLMAGWRLAEPLETLAQHVAQRAIELVVEALDINALLDQIDVNRLLDRVDADRLIARVDVDALLDRVDVDRLIARVDVDALLERVDVDALLGRIDVNELASRVDVDAVLERTELRGVLSRSSSTIASEGVDLVRSQAVGLDDFVARWVSRLRHRTYSGPPAWPGRRALPGSPSLQAER